MGELLSGTSVGQVSIVTKFKISKEAVGDFSLAKEQARSSVLASLQQLKLARLPFCLFHMVSDYNTDVVAEMLPGLFVSLKQEGLIGSGGISIDNLSELPRLAFLPEVSVLQLPLNIFDQRFPEDHPVWEQLEKENKIVFARSVFLKGLLLRNPSALTGNLQPAAFYLEGLAAFAKRCKMSIAQFCFSYVRNFKAIDSIVVGADNEAQLLENIGLMRTPPIPQQILEEAKFFLRMFRSSCLFLKIGNCKK